MVPDRQSGTCVGSSLPTQDVSATAMGVRGVIASDVVVEIKVKPIGADPPNEVEAVTGRRSCTRVSWGSLSTQVASAAAMGVWEAIASDMVVEIVVQPIVVVTMVVSMVIVVFVIAIVILLMEKEALTVLVIGCAAIVMAAPEGVVALVAPKPSYERVSGR